MQHLHSNLIKRAPTFFEQKGKRSARNRAHFALSNDHFFNDTVVDGLNNWTSNEMQILFEDAYPLMSWGTFFELQSYGLMLGALDVPRHKTFPMIYGVTIMAFLGVC